MIKNKELLQIGERYKIFDNLLEGCQVISRDFRYLYVNNVLEKHGQKLKEKLLGKTMMESYPGIEKTKMFATIKKCMKDRVSRVFENEFTFPDGSKDWFKLKFEPVLEGLLIFSEDITKQRKIEIEKEKIRIKSDLAMEINKIGIWELDLIHDTAIRNLIHDQIFGYKKMLKNWGQEIFFRHILSEDRPSVQKAFNVALETNKLFFECRIIWPDKSIHWITATGKVMRDDTRKPVKMYGTVTDITERKTSELAIKETKEKLEIIFKNPSVGMSLVSPEGRWLQVNNALCKIVGYSENELLFRKFYDITFPEDQKKTKTFLKSLYNVKIKEGQLEKRYIHKNGNVIWVSINVSVVRDSEGRPMYFVVITNDITKKKKVEEEYRKLSFVIENTLEGHAIIDLGKTNLLTYVNKAWEKITGYNSSEVTNKKTALILDAVRNNPEQKKRLISSVKSGNAFQEEMVWKTKYGKDIIVDVLSMPLYEDGKIVSWFNTIRDITEKKKTETELETEKKFLKSIIDLNPYAIQIHDKNGHYISGNKAFFKMFKIAPPPEYNFFEDPIATKAGFHEKNLTVREGKVHKAHEMWYNLHWLDPKFPDKLMCFRSSVFPIMDHDNKLDKIVIMYEDITNEKIAEKDLVESENKLSTTLKSIGDAVIVTDIDSKIIFINHAAQKLTNWSENEAVNQPLIKVFDIFNEGTGNKIENPVTSVIRGGKVVGLGNHTVLISKNGKKLSIEDSAAPVMDDKGKIVGVVLVFHDVTKKREFEEKIKESEEKYRRLFESARDSILILDLETGEITDSNPFIEKILGYSKHELLGKKIYEVNPFKDIIKNKEKFLELAKEKYVKYENLPLQTKKGEIKYIEFISNIYGVGDKKVIQCNIRDVSERVELDQAKTGFLSIASHQLRTPLSMTKWVLESLVKEQNLLPKQIEKINSLQYSNERLIGLINDLLNVALIDTGKIVVNKKNTDLKKIVDDLSITFKFATIKNQKSIKLVVSPDLKDVYCDPVLIHEAIENLLNNAINYSPIGSHEITVKINERKNDYLVSVHNDGIIDPLSIEKIKKFDKFVRGINATEVLPGGSGLGLYVVKKIIEINGGNVWFESNIESGTTFYLAINKK